MSRLKFPPLQPEQRERLLARTSGPFSDFLGIRLLEIEAGFARLELTFKPELTHAGGIVQGGLIATIADHAIALAVGAALGGEIGHTSIDLKINFIRAVPKGNLTAEAWLIHLGSRTAVGESVVTDDQGRVVAKCLSSVMILPEGRRHHAPGAK